MDVSERPYQLRQTQILTINQGIEVGTPTEVKGRIEEAEREGNPTGNPAVLSNLGAPRERVTDQTA